MRQYIKRFVLLSMIVCWHSVQAESEVLVLGIPLLKPFTYLEDGKIQGSMIKPVEKALNDSGIPFKFRFLENYSLLLKSIRSQKVHGFFVATKNIERDRYGHFSKPFIIDKYSWFILNDAQYAFGEDDFIYKAKIGAVSNTNSFRLATRRGYQVYSQPSELLAHNFINKNIDAVFAAHIPFEFQLEQMAVSKKQYRTITDSIRPFGMYISKEYVARNPGTMEKLNSNIKTINYQKED